MGLTQKLGTIPLAIQTDSSNNVGIGGTPSGSFKFEAIGLTRLASSGATILTINSTNANGSANVYQQSGTNIAWIGNGSSSLIGGSTNDFTINGQTNINLAIGGYSKVIVNSSGNVGIGTSSPQRTFDARGTVNLSTTAPTVGSTSGAYADVHLRTFSGYPTAQAKIVVVDFWTDFYSTYTDGFRWFNWDSAGTTPVERMRITSGGRVGINTTSPSGILGVTGVDGAWSAWIQGTTTSSQSYGLLVQSGTTSSDYSMLVRNAAGGAPYIYVRGDGYLYSASAWSGSDRRLKENITDLDNGLKKILGLKARKYDFINGFKNQYGFIAQELQEVIPDAVSIFDEEKELLAVKMDFIIPHLVKAIQELNEKVTALENK